jgi:hypothetical protein
VSDSQSIGESWVCLDAEEGEWNNAFLLGHLAGFMDRPRNERICENPDAAELRSDNLEAIMAFYRRLQTAEEKSNLQGAAMRS